jgi:hypothetical protein
MNKGTKITMQRYQINAFNSIYDVFEGGNKILKATK